MLVYSNLCLSVTTAADQVAREVGAHSPDKRGMRGDGHPVESAAEASGHRLVRLTQAPLHWTLHHPDKLLDTRGKKTFTIKYNKIHIKCQN